MGVGTQGVPLLVSTACGASNTGLIAKGQRWPWLREAAFETRAVFARMESDGIPKGGLI
jgi:hypothetical protein